MFVLEGLLFLLFIAMGIRLGGLGIGFSGACGVLFFTFFFGLKAGSIPMDVILIIMSVISIIAVMEKAGGLEYLVQSCEKLLRKQPHYLIYLAPIVTYALTFFSGTGHTAFAALPVIKEISKEQGIRPVRPLVISVISSQLAITASPLSPAFLIYNSFMEERGVSYFFLVKITFISTFLATIIGSVFVSLFPKYLKDDPNYIQNIQEKEKKPCKKKLKEPQQGAQLSLLIFVLSILCMIAYAFYVSQDLALDGNIQLSKSQATVAFMLSGAMAMCFFCDVDISKVTMMSTFRSGMSACVCIIGVSWLGDTIIQAHWEKIIFLSKTLMQEYSFALPIILFISSILFYSQAACTKALMPIALALVSDPILTIPSFFAVSALFVLPTYPTLLAAVEIDDTGTTKIGKYVLNHPFLIPGVFTIMIAILVGYLCLYLNL